MHRLQSVSSEGVAGRGRTLPEMGVGAVRNFCKRFQEDVSGATAIEYALIASIVSLSIIAGATTIGTGLIDIFTSVNNGFPATGS